ncbi:hypothetical protein F2Q69_00037020 [Brassica cretica]|uniref:Uncharacterized protein n=1 Tax=Brassica cretica TaxID=69181 RepID=A0A8S9SFC8_BRACR|nr:hypothetical protein F2Q69_00037020 [Brassica cretica]
MIFHLSRSRALYLRRLSPTRENDLPSLSISSSLSPTRLYLRRNPSPELSLYLRREKPISIALSRSRAISLKLSPTQAISDASSVSSLKLTLLSSSLSPDPLKLTLWRYDNYTPTPLQLSLTSSIFSELSPTSSNPVTSLAACLACLAIFLATSMRLSLFLSSLLRLSMFLSSSLSCSLISSSLSPALSSPSPALSLALSSQAHSLPLFLSLFKMAKDVSIELEYVYEIRLALEGEEGDDDDDDDGGGGHIVYEPTGDRMMEALRKSITDEYGRGRLPY